MIGGIILDTCLDDPRVARVTSVGRRTSGREHAKLTEIVHADLDDARAIADALVGVHVTFFCMGTYTGVVSDEELRRTTVDFARGFASVVASRSPGSVFCLLSGHGADRSESSRIPFKRYKGMAENALLKLEFSRVLSMRPGYIHPVEPRTEPNWMYRAMRWVFPLARVVFTNTGIRSTELARAMYRACFEPESGGKDVIYENRDLRRLGERE